MKTRPPKDLGIKIAPNKTVAKWIEILDRAETEKIQLQCELEINANVIELAKTKVK